MWGGYGNHFVCVFVCYHATAIPHLYIENEDSLCHFPDLLRVAFTKNAVKRIWCHLLTIAASLAPWQTLDGQRDSSGFLSM